MVYPLRIYLNQNLITFNSLSMTSWKSTLINKKQAKQQSQPIKQAEADLEAIRIKTL